MFAARSCISWLAASAGSDAEMPSSAPLVGALPSRLALALGRLDPLPLAVDVRRGARLGLAEHVRMAPDDLRRDRGLDVGQVEHAGLGGELRVEHDLQPQVAELAGELRRGTRLERVVDLVRLLEQVVAQRLVRLLAIPRAAVGRPEAVADGRHRPRSRTTAASGASGAR